MSSYLNIPAQSGGKVLLHPALSANLGRGQISARVAELTSQAINELSSRHKYKLSELKEMVGTCPVVAAAINLKALRASSSLGRYSHPDKKIQAWVEDNFSQMRGSLLSITKQLFASSLSLGVGVAEIVWDTKIKGMESEWRLKTLNVIDPERIRFAGGNGEITHITYRHENERIIPYSKLLHITNDLLSFNNPWGYPDAVRAYPLYKARQILLGEWLVAAKNQATPIMLGQVNSQNTVRLLGADNKPLKNADGSDRTSSANEALLIQLSNLDNNSIIVTDLENRITPIPSSTGGLEFQSALAYFQRLLWLCFGLPALMFEEGSGSLGINGAAMQQFSLFDSHIESVVSMLRDAMVENVVRPLLKVNFPNVTDYGSFQVDTNTDPNTSAVRISNLISAISVGIFSAQDPEIVNELRKLLGIPELSETDIQAIADAKMIEDQLKAEAAMMQDSTDQAG